MLFGTAPAHRRYPIMSRIVLPLAIIALVLVACDNSRPTTADMPLPPQAEVAATTPAAPPAMHSPPPEHPRPYFKTPAPGEELPTSQTTPGLVPLEYRYVWAIDRNDCTAAESPTRIAIAPGAVRSRDGRAVISSTDESRPGILVLHTDRLAGEQTIKEAHTLTLDSSGKMLAYTNGDTNRTYIRCE